MCHIYTAVSVYCMIIPLMHIILGLYVYTLHVHGDAAIDSIRFYLLRRISTGTVFALDICHLKHCNM